MMGQYLGFVYQGYKEVVCSSGNTNLKKVNDEDAEFFGVFGIEGFGSKTWIRDFECANRAKDFANKASLLTATRQNSTLH